MSSILCMFSGGIDSTGVLHKLITDKQYAGHDIIVHHIRMINIENRATAESLAVESIFSYYDSIASNKLTFTDSTFDSLGFKNLNAKRFPFDSDVQAFVAANICWSRPDITQVAFGQTKTDVLKWNPNRIKRRLRRQHVFNAVLLNVPKPYPKFIFPVSSYTKKEIWNFLPDSVRERTWWCRRPIYDNGKPKACRSCQTCKEVLEYHVF